MEIIKCNCGYYKQLNDELCPNCKADYSLGADYEVLEDQEAAYMRWNSLGEKGFNDYMNSINKPVYMLCPKCQFKMLATESNCPRCGIGVVYKGKRKEKWTWFSYIAIGACICAIIAAVAPLLLSILAFIMSLFM